MNESLAKQLHDLISFTKWQIKDAVSEEFQILDIELNKLLEQELLEENTNE